jgi:hypothetical protein
MPFDDSIGNITLKPKSCSSTNKFQKNEMKNYISINNEDSKQIIKKTCCSSLHQMDSMIKNMHKSWSLID